MDFGLNEDQLTLQKYARDFLENECPSAFVRPAMDSDTAHDPAFYEKMAGLGWMGIAIPESLGGQGMSYVDLAVLVEEMGRAIAPGPFFASVCLAAPVVDGAGTETQKKALLPAIASGEKIATVAFTEASGRVDEAGIQLTATRDGGAWVLQGSKHFVPDAHVADALVVAARAADGVKLFLVPSDAVAVSQVPTMDMTRRWCDVTFDDVRVDDDAVMAGGWPELERALQKTAALLAAECVGGAQKVLDVSVAYAKERMQFGRPIGSFQAVKHRCADMLIDVEMARSAMYYAAWAAAEDDAELALAASVAKAYCGDAYCRVATNGILVHGGIGFTWEHDAHLYFKRAKCNELLLGETSHHNERVAQLIA